VTNSYLYDNWLRPATNNNSTSGWRTLNKSWSYDARGLVVGMSLWRDYSVPITLTRGYDAYAQLILEAINLPTVHSSSVAQSWDAAGRRVSLNFGGARYAFNWRADGALAGVSTPQGGASYGYDSAGVLTNRTAGNRTTALTSRDGTGRPLSLTTRVNTAAKLIETLGWTGDGLLSTHTLAREDFTDWRSYAYADWTRRLIEERLNLNASARWTNAFTYDGNAGGGPGVLTRVGSPASGPARWSGGVNPFAQVEVATNANIRRTAYGRVNGSASITALLDGVPQPLTVLGTDDPAWTNQWRAMMELGAGAHQLTVSATHPSGQFTTNASVWFTNNATHERVVDSYDGKGQLTRRTWVSAGGVTNRTQTLEWEPTGWLYRVLDQDSQNNGYWLNPIHDPLGRRVGALWGPLIGGAGVEVHFDAHYYDPQVEFLELGHAADYGQTTWKLYGPDLNGRYGGMNGTGGLEAVLPGQSQFQPLISDARGNVLGAVSNSVVNWTAARPTGYGAVPGCRPLPLGQGGDTAQACAWRGRWADLTGYIWLGARYYDPEAGSFLDSDPVWNNRDPNYYTFCGGDPINSFDPDGRLGKGLFAGRESTWGGPGLSSDSSGAFSAGYYVGRDAALIGQNISRFIDFGCNVVAGLFGTPNPEGASMEQRQALAERAIKLYGSPLGRWGAYPQTDTTRQFIEQLPASLTGPAQDAMMAYAARPGVSGMTVSPTPPRATQWGAPVEPYYYGANSYQTWQPSGSPPQLVSGRNAEGPALANQGFSQNQTVFTPTPEQMQSAAFQVMVGPPKYTRGNVPIGTKFDSIDNGVYLEYKSGSSFLDSSYQLRLQTYFSVVNSVPYIIQTTRPVNPEFQEYLRRWGATVQRPPQ
jgi:RHS repeat-associated protein